MTKKSRCLSCRKELREQLKRQIEEKCVELKLQVAGKVKEAEHLREVDRLAVSSEREQRIHHSKAMTAYRDENKRVKSHTYIMYPLLMLLCLCPLRLGPENASTCWLLSGYNNIGSVWGFSLVCAANGAELEGQSTNTLSRGHEGERAAVPQPH